MNFDTISSNLRALGYTVTCFETAAEAADYLDTQIDGTSVGFGGSVTARQMNLWERLGAHNETVWHWFPEEGKTAEDARKAARTTEIYISSVNGISESGEIINIDGAGNRVAETLYGHKKVYFLIGCNKIAPDYDAALYRARNIACPKNAQRLHMATPCALKGDRCYNCSSPKRICRALTVLWVKPLAMDYEIVLINEPLGF